ncbi:hypothetical protein DL98DRAFT_119166 [Cadophora sp. DSE1049]|nr:hypothetical protein DL98DRAFT_119166 [Cadophora sp. DSE1049]
MISPSMTCIPTSQASSVYIYSLSISTTSQIHLPSSPNSMIGLPAPLKITPPSQKNHLAHLNMFPRIPNAGGLFPRRLGIGGLAGLLNPQQAQQQQPAVQQPAPAPQQLITYQQPALPQQLVTAQPYPQLVPQQPGNPQQANFPQLVPPPSQNALSPLDPRYSQVQQQFQQPQPQNPLYPQAQPQAFAQPLQPGYISLNDILNALTFSKRNQPNELDPRRAALATFNHRIAQKTIKYVHSAERLTYLVNDQGVLAANGMWVQAGMPGRRGEGDREGVGRCGGREAGRGV